MRWLLAPFQLVWRVTHRILEERLTQTAAALSFATLGGALIVAELPGAARKER